MKSTLEFFMVDLKASCAPMYTCWLDCCRVPRKYKNLCRLQNVQAGEAGSKVTSRPPYDTRRSSIRWRIKLWEISLTICLIVYWSKKRSKIEITIIQRSMWQHRHSVRRPLQPSSSPLPKRSPKWGRFQAQNFGQKYFVPCPLSRLPSPGGSPKGYVPNFGTGSTVSRQNFPFFSFAGKSFLWEFDLRHSQ